MRSTGKKVLAFFGLFFLLAIFSLILIYNFSSDDDELIYSTGNGTVAIVEVNDAIIESTEIIRQIKKYRKNNSIRGIVLRVNSPGGGVAASQEIYEEIKKTRESGIPIVVSMGSVAASGGYYISLGANVIMANPGTMTGSIGVIMEFTQYNKLMDKIGVSQTTIKSGKFKDAGSPYRQITKEENLKFQSMLDDVYNQFVETVVKERKMEKSKAINLADGSVYTGRQAYENKLIDTLGTFENAIELVAKLGGINGEPSVLIERKKENIVDMIFSKIYTEMISSNRKLINETLLQYSLKF